MASAPTSELGSVAPFTAIPGWKGLASYTDDTEDVPELRWQPDGYGAVATYERMRGDAQVHALWSAMTLPIRRYRWMIDPNGARDVIVEKLSEDLGLPIQGAEADFQRRTRGRFSWQQHLYHVLLGLVYGHMFFEQVGEIRDSMWRLRKLAPRLPRTISDIKVADDGGLVYIKQNVANGPEIPVDRLVAYIWQQEAGNWTGRSMLRPLYRHWLVKDILIRVDALKHERNGMGMPFTRQTDKDVVPSPADQAKALGMAQAVRAGEDAGGYLPYGLDLELKGVQGNLPDTLGSIRYHDEAMARALLAMFMQIGVTSTGHGSTQQAETQLDFFSLGQETVALWAADVSNEHIVEDWVDWNYGETEALVPRIVFERDDDPMAAVGTLLEAVGAGAIVMDPDTENWLRQQLGAPERQDDAPAPPAPAPAAARARPQRAKRHMAAAADTPGVEHVDFDELQASWQRELGQVLEAWGTVRAGQIDELVAAIAAAGDLTDLTQLAAASAGTDELAASMETLLAQGADSVITEAAAQGRTLSVPPLDTLRDQLRSRADAVAALLARSLSETAARQAVARSSDQVSMRDVADQVREHLEGLSDTYLEQQLGGALTQAQATGRREVMRVHPPVRIYASELLDANTCEVCADLDGKEYASLEEAEQDYPTGGAADCLGGPQCRGTLVAVYDESEAA